MKILSVKDMINAFEQSAEGSDERNKIFDFAVDEMKTMSWLDGIRDAGIAIFVAGLSAKGLNALTRKTRLDKTLKK